MESTALLSRKAKAVKISNNTLLHLNQVASNMVSCFNNIKSPMVLGEIDISDFIESIKNPEPSTRRAIEEARELKAKGDTDRYESIKKALPCFTLSFSYNDRKKDANIKAPTGFVYIDIDGTLDIDLTNPLIFASWKSLSGLGRGVLVKAENLLLENFKSTYFEIAESLGMQADKYAAKASQYNVHSHDEDIYLNIHSLTWYAKDKFVKTPSTLTYKKRKEKDVEVMGEILELTYNNIADFDFGDKDYLFFPDEKSPFAEAFIPSTILVGARNQILSAFATQMRALNPYFPHEEFIKFIVHVNRSRCVEPLKDEEVFSMVSKILEMEYIEPIYNKFRRVIFNPASTLTKKEKIVVTNKFIGTLKIAKTKAEIKDCLDNWNLETIGKVTQQKLAKEANKNIKTIEKYYKEFKYQRTSINNQLRSS